MVASEASAARAAAVVAEEVAVAAPATGKLQRRYALISKKAITRIKHLRHASALNLE